MWIVYPSRHTLHQQHLLNDQWKCSGKGSRSAVTKELKPQRINDDRGCSVTNNYNDKENIKDMDSQRKRNPPIKIASSQSRFTDKGGPVTTEIQWQQKCNDKGNPIGQSIQSKRKSNQSGTSIIKDVQWHRKWNYKGSVTWKKCGDNETVLLLVCEIKWQKIWLWDGSNHLGCRWLCKCLMIYDINSARYLSNSDHVVTENWAKCVFD